MNFSGIIRFAAVVLALSAPLSGATLIDPDRPVKVNLHTPEARGQSARMAALDGRNALRIDYDCGKSKYFEFAYQQLPAVTPFVTGRIRVQVYIPDGSRARKLNLRLNDKDGETFQFSGDIAKGESGWRELSYSIVAESPRAGAWGGGAKANKKLDFPVRLRGFACDFNSAEGASYIGIGKVELDVLTSDQPLPARLETGSPVSVVTPESAAPAITIANTFEAAVNGNLAYRLSDAYGTEIAAKSEAVSIAPGETWKTPLPAVAKFGVYRVDVQYREEGKKPFDGIFRFAFMRPAGPTPGRASGFLFGVCSHPQGASPADQEREALAAALCGAKVMRTDMYWEYIQPKPDVWNFTRLDNTVDIFAKQNIEVQAIYCYLPGWAAAKEWKPFSTQRKGKARPNYDHWRNFIRRSAEHYRGKIRYVEVWNEPDHVGFANFPVSEYIEMMKIAYEETKKAAPEMTVLTGGYTGMPHRGSRSLMEADHMERTLTEGRGSYDIFAFHGHGSFAGYRGQIERLVKMTKELGVTVPWYANETAISSIHIGEMAQATTLFQKFLYSWARGAMGYNWYDLRNDGYGEKENEHNFGLITRDFQPKIAYGVYNTLSNLFHRASYLQDLKISGAMAFFFRAANGDILLPGWSDDRDRLLLLSGVAGRVSRVDLFGNEEEIPVENGSCVIELHKLPATLRFAGQKDVPMVHGEFFRQLDDISCRPGHARRYYFELMNPTAQPLAFRLEFHAPEGLTPGKYPRTVTVAPRKSETVALEIAAAADFRSFHGQQKELTLKLGVGRFWQGVLNFPALSVTVLEKQLRARPDFVLDRADQAVFLAPNTPQTAHLFWTGPEDLSAKVFLGHDGANLLLKAEVTDDVHWQPESGEHVWRGDNIQFALKLPKQRELWEIGLTRRNDGKSEVFIWSGTGDLPKAAAAIRLETSRDEKTKITTYFARIPFSAIGLDADARKNGFRFNLLVNDNDGELRETFISIAPGIGLAKTPDSYPVVLFEE